MDDIVEMMKDNERIKLMHMTDREKVLKGLECCSKDECALNDNCPYGKEDANYCLERLTADALDLLKEQKPVVPKRMHHNERASFDNYLCKCKNELYYKQKFCDECGRPVKWDI